MANFTVPTKNNVSEANQAIFNQLEQGVGFVPNLFAYFAHNETALGDYLGLQNRKSTLSAKQKEIVNLVVSEVNGCAYCKAAHTAIGKMQGFTEDQILEIRGGRATFDTQLDVLAQFTKAVALNRGKVDDATKTQFIEAGFTQANLVDVVIAIGDKIITNYLHNITEIPVDFPAAVELETLEA